MKRPTMKTAHGRRWDPCYVVNDWGADAYFIGHNYQCSPGGTHSHTGQTDYVLCDPITIEALCPDGEVRRVNLKPAARRTRTVGDMGNRYPVTSDVWGVVQECMGASASLDPTRFYFDLKTIEAAP